MTFKDLARIIRRRWLTIAAVVTLALIVAGAVSFLATPKYQSTARVFVSSENSSPQDAYAGSLFSAQRVASYADLADSRVVMTRVVRDLKLKVTPEELATQVDASVVQDTIIILITVTDSDASAAQRIAQNTARELTSYVGQIETVGRKSVSPVKASIIDPADVNEDAVYPNTELNLAVALVLGLLIGVSVAVTREVLDTSVKSVEDTEAVLAAPVLATVTYDPALEKSGTAGLGPNSVRSEDFRLLRTTLQFADLDGDPRSFVITSSLPQEGKSSTALGLAAAVAQTGKRVLLVDGDLRHPSLADRLGLEGKVGLTTVLVGGTSLEECIQRHDDTGVFVLTSGGLPPNPTEILQSQAARDLFTEARTSFDVVIIDSPPLLPVADAAILAVDADGAILVTRHGKTHRHDLELARTRLEAVGARLFGGVLNMTPRGGAQGYGYGDTVYGYQPGKQTSTGKVLEAVRPTAASRRAEGGARRSR